MKIIFLDIDGVLNSEEWIMENHEKILAAQSSLIYRGETEINPSALDMIKTLVEKTDAKIVISSSWRILYNKDELNKIFRESGWNNFELFDVTPHRLPGRTIRGDEVNAWLNSFGREKIEKFICIDDDSDFYPDQNLVKTSWKKGFQSQHLELALQLLNS